MRDHSDHSRTSNPTNPLGKGFIGSFDVESFSDVRSLVMIRVISKECTGFCLLGSAVSVGWAGDIHSSRK